MSDLKSKLPDLNEISAMATKLFKDVSTSICEIVDQYKEKRQDPPVESSSDDHTTPPKP